MSTNLKKGMKAPAFSVQDQDGNMVSLKDFAGKKVALYFYPKDNTPGCTEQACNLRDNFAKLKKKGVVILGVSVDSMKKHKNFENKYSLPFTLLADTEHELVNAYGVWGEKKMFGRAYMGIFRTTFLIDEQGKIAHIIDDVDTKDHAQQILDTWGL
jgi:peroxiredoxin Q/BCP